LLTYSVSEYIIFDYYRATLC